MRSVCCNKQSLLTLALTYSRYCAGLGRIIIMTVMPITLVLGWLVQVVPSTVVRASFTNQSILAKAASPHRKECLFWFEEETISSLCPRDTSTQGGHFCFLLWKSHLSSLQKIQHPSICTFPLLCSQCPHSWFKDFSQLKPRAQLSIQFSLWDTAGKKTIHF